MSDTTKVESIIIDKAEHERLLKIEQEYIALQSSLMANYLNANTNLDLIVETAFKEKQRLRQQFSS